jgi:hypothetical protein
MILVSEPTIFINLSAHAGHPGLAMTCTTVRTPSLERGGPLITNATWLVSPPHGEMSRSGANPSILGESSAKRK